MSCVGGLENSRVLNGAYDSYTGRKAERKKEEEKERKQNAAQITETKTSAEPGCPVPCKDKAFLYLVRFCESWIGFVPFIYR